jgi:hypothetical protein
MGSGVPLLLVGTAAGRVFKSVAGFANASATTRENNPFRPT